MTMTMTMMINVCFELKQLLNVYFINIDHYTIYIHGTCDVVLILNKVMHTLV